jgi:hypothetical protein
LLTRCSRAAAEGTRDRLADVRERIAEEGLMVSGSTGKPRTHPSLTLERGLAGDLWRAPTHRSWPVDGQERRCGLKAGERE